MRNSHVYFTKKEDKSCLRRLNELIFVLQIVTEGMGEAFLRMKLKDQSKALAMISGDAQLADLRQIRAPLVDYEVRGLPALQYFGGMVWQDALDDYSQGETGLALRMLIT